MKTETLTISDAIEKSVENDGKPVYVEVRDVGKAYDQVRDVLDVSFEDPQTAEIYHSFKKDGMHVFGCTACFEKFHIIIQQENSRKGNA